ncbi:uncharacterized protein TM35_001031060, partial [Trypanosoma theileri]
DDKREQTELNQVSPSQDTTQKDQQTKNVESNDPAADVVTNEDRLASGTSVSEESKSANGNATLGVLTDSADSTSANSNLTQQSPAESESQENTSTTSPSIENTTTEAPTTTPSPVPNAETSSNIVSTVQNKANADSSSINPVWLRTAAPLLIVAVLFSVTLY